MKQKGIYHTETNILGRQNFLVTHQQKRKAQKRNNTKVLACLLTKHHITSFFELTTCNFLKYNVTVCDEFTAEYVCYVLRWIDRLIGWLIG